MFVTQRFVLGAVLDDDLCSKVSMIYQCQYTARWIRDLTHCIGVLEHCWVLVPLIGTALVSWILVTAIVGICIYSAYMLAKRREQKHLQAAYLHPT